MERKNTAIVLAAGQGKRMNSKVQKQFLELGGKPLLYYSLKCFQGGKFKASDTGRVHWSGKNKKNTENLYRSSKTAKGCAGSRAFLRPSRTGKNNFVRNHCK